MKTFVADAVPAQAWKNGGGLTRELLAWPAAGEWQLRVSVADITRDGPFSAFPGVERWFAVLEGAGVMLALADGERRVVPGDPPLRFDGAQAPPCRLIDGPTRDLNLMLRGARGGLQATEPAAAWTSPTDRCGLFAHRPGRWQCDDGRETSLPALALLWLDRAPRLPQRFDGSGWWLHFESAKEAR